jgi:hypothetical protein
MMAVAENQVVRDRTIAMDSTAKIAQRDASAATRRKTFEVLGMTKNDAEGDIEAS